MASASLSRESFNDAVEKALEALKDSSIESLTKYQSDASSLEDIVSLAGHEILFTSPEVLETGGARK